MNTKKIMLILALLSMTIFFAACGNSNDPSNTTSNTDDDASNDINISLNSRPDLSGQVEKILGNEVTLSVAELPEQGEQGDLSPEEREKRREEMQNMSPEERQQMMRERIKFTGETEKLIIPVGTPIISGRGEKITQLELGDIYAGMMLQFWFEKGENGLNDTVKYVRVNQSR